VAVGFDSVASVQPYPLTETWDALVAVLKVHREQESKEDGNLWSPVSYHDGATRGLGGVDKVEAFVLDVDEVGLAALRPRLNGLAYIAYSTWSFGSLSGINVVVPFAQAVAVWKWSAMWGVCHDYFGRLGEVSCRDASRIFYRPHHAVGAQYFVEVGCGDYLEPPSRHRNRT